MPTEFGTMKAVLYFDSLSDICQVCYYVEFNYTHKAPGNIKPEHLIYGEYDIPGNCNPIGKTAMELLQYASKDKLPMFIHNKK